MGPTLAGQKCGEELENGDVRASEANDTLEEEDCGCGCGCGNILPEMQGKDSFNKRGGRYYEEWETCDQSCLCRVRSWKVPCGQNSGIINVGSVFSEVLVLSEPSELFTFSLVNDFTASCIGAGPAA